MWSWKYEGVGKEMGSPEGRKFAASALLSLLIVLGGILWTLQIGKDGNLLHHRLAHAREALEGIHQVVRANDLSKGTQQ
jgi:hypothetical protein